MRILVVKAALPWPPNQGTRRVSLALLQALSVAHEVTLVTQYFAPGEAADARALAEAAGCRVIAELAPNRRSRWHRLYYKVATLLGSLLGGHSPRVLYAASPALRRAAARATAETPADLVIFEYWYTYPAFAGVRARQRVLLAHDAEFVVNRLAAARGAGVRSFWSASEARRESEALRAVDRVWTLTREDADALAASSGVPRDRFDVMPFGIDLAVLSPAPRAAAGTAPDRPPAPRPAEAPPTVLFFGSFVADFNRDALDWLLDAIWPALRRRMPEARLRVAGSGLDEARQARVRQAGAEYRGAVDDVAALYAAADVVLIPLRFGGGLRIRLLEALACGRAIVATPVGIGGIEGRSGTHFVVAGDPEGLAQEVAELLSHPEEAARLGAAGRRLVEERHALPVAMAGIRTLAEAAAVVPEAPDPRP